jgi:hypothetical protein
VQKLALELSLAMQRDELADADVAERLGVDRSTVSRWVTGKARISRAHHAGVGDATLSPLFATPICARCERGATRLIHGHLCVSCMNRQYEYRKGANARGNAPVTHPSLHQAAIRYRAGGRIKTLRRDDVANPSELVIAALRDLGYSLPSAVKACQGLQAVPGRMQRVGKPQQPAVVVDYAHTPDAVDKALRALLGDVVQIPVQIPGDERQEPPVVSFDSAESAARARRQAATVVEIEIAARHGQGGRDG